MGFAGTMSSPCNTIMTGYDGGVGYAGTISSPANAIGPGCGVGVGYAGAMSSSVSTSALTAAPADGEGVWCAAGPLGSPVGASFTPDTGPVTDQDLELLAMLQQQDTKLAEVDATIQQLLNIKQQVLAMRQPVLAPTALAAPAAAPVPLWPGMSAQQSMCAVALPAAAASCTASSGSFVQQHVQQAQVGPTGSSSLNNALQQQGRLGAAQTELLQMLRLS